jgi:uroporphyrinogen-III synthase
MSISLKGIRILNTRPLQQATELKKTIETHGGICVNCPTILIEPNSHPWGDYLPALSTAQFAIFTSANAVHYFFKQLQECQISWPTNIKIIAIGHATAKSIETIGLHVDFLPKLADSEHLLSLDVLQSIRTQTVLLIKGEGGRKLIEKTLNKRGAQVVSLPVYIRKPCLHAPEFIASIWRNNLVDIILLTSGEGINHLLQLFSEPNARNWLFNKTCIVYSERLATLARIQGFKSIRICSPNALLSTLTEYQPKD